MRHVVQYSTGVTSAEVAWRVAAEHGPADVTLLTADTRAEDEDNWRFAGQVAARLGCEWITVADGRTPMQAGRDARIVPNSRLPVCSRVLKRDLLWAWMREHCDPADTVVYLGFDWTEEHRVEAARVHWKPWTVDCPLTREPHVWKPDLLDTWRERGIEPPRLYAQGFSHANCGGACVRGGQAQWALLLQVNRPRYLEWEAKEQKTRELTGKDVAIMRDRRGGTSTPLTLAEFRERAGREPARIDRDDWGACGCDMTGEPAVSG